MVNNQFRYLYVFLLILIRVIAAVFQVAGIQTALLIFFPDEADMAFDAQSFMKGGIYLVTPHEGREGALYPSLMAPNFGLFGAGILQARMLTAVLSTLSAGVALVFLHRLRDSPQRRSALFYHLSVRS
jgi:predicted membrane-bound mannosyltransferase